MGEEILIVGNPNTGKSTFFNSLTNMKVHTGNFHGVTVNFTKAEAKIENKVYTFVDLPGLYSLTPNSYEEKVSVDYILSHKNSKIICLCSNQTLKRNLLLVRELMMLKREILVVVNMVDKHVTFDKDRLEKLLGLNTIVLKANNKKSFNEFFAYLKNIKSNIDDTNYENFYKQKMQCGSEYYASLLNIKDFKINEIYHKNLENYIKNEYKKIDEILNSINYKQLNTVGKSKLDKILLNKYLCLPIFFCILIVIFYLTFFSLGKFLSDNLRYLIQDLLGKEVVSFLVEKNVPNFVVSLISEGIFGGVGSVVSFLPQVVILFLFLDILEQSGYISRLAFCLDDTLKYVGLSGRSVYTLIMGFGCSTTASLTARNMSDNNAKIKTALLSPYMSCSAKLPVYAVIGGAFFGAQNIVIIVLLYILGVIVALLMSLFLEKTKLKSTGQTFIMEFPSYQKISLKHTIQNVWESTWAFLIRIGSVILSLSIVIWLLQNLSFSLTYVKYSGEKSILQVLGELLSFVFKPLGFSSWGAVSALIAGLVAKEVIVSSIAIFNGVNIDAISQSIVIASNAVFFTPASAMSFMVFCLLYCPCISTIATFKKEIGTKWTIFSIISQFLVAYVAAMFTYTIFRITELYGFLTTFVIVVIVAIVLGTIIHFIGKNKKVCAFCSKHCINKVHK